MGQSRQPPIELPIPILGGAMAGEESLTQLLRQAEKLEKMAALVFHVDSPGGSALASDIIGREIDRLSRRLPVVVYMSNVAASGGYYVSALARHIVAQPGTLTGSIGVISARLSTEGLYRRLQANREVVQRGERADLYSRPERMSAEERHIFWDGVVHSYRQFKEVVARGRNIPYEALDPICQGRVWSGRQALERGLVDSHGDLVDAVRLAAELAGLPTDDRHTIPVANLYVKQARHLLPQPYEGAQSLARLLSGEEARHWLGRPLLLLPFELRLW